MDFQLLQLRLVAHIKERVRNGEATERGLARLSGISQPHMHNVLKGARIFSPELADQVLRRLHIDLVDLLEGETGDATRRTREFRHRMVPLLAGHIGPKYPYPASGPVQGGYPFLLDDLHGLESPVAARLAHDPNMPEGFSADAVVLLDRSPACCTNPGEGYYALDFGGESGIRLVRPTMRRLYLLGKDAGEDIQNWPSFSLQNRRPQQLIKGKVSLLVRRP